MTKEVNPLTWKKRLQGLFLDRDDFDSSEIEREAAEAGVEHAATCTIGSKVRLQGVIRSATFRPLGATPVYNVTLDDGTRTIEIVFLGRRYIRGVDCGRHMRVQGRLQVHEGSLTIFNPSYELIHTEGV